MTTASTVPSRRALLIGINKYPKFPAERQLHGCLNDVKLMQTTLREHFGFPAENMTILLDEQATRVAILAALDALAAAVNSDDVVVVHYSGHGSQVLDRQRIEPDGMNETVVAHDSSHTMPEPNRDVTDKEIYLRLFAMGQKTANITLLFDCCNSGTIARATLGGVSRGVPADRRPPAELGLPDLTAAEQEIVRTSHRGIGPNQWFPMSDRYVLLASCRDEETSFEYPPQPGDNDTIQGTLTFFLHQELIKAGPGTTYRDVFERVQRQVTTVYPGQHPQMEGTRDRELFGLRDFEPMRFVGVSRRQGDRITLAAGAAHGLTAESVWAIYPQGVKQVDAKTPRQALARVAEVRGQTSDATLVEESSPGAVVPGSRAVEVEHNYGDLALRVELVLTAPDRQAEADDLGKRIDQSPMLRRAQAGDRVAVQVYLLPARASVGPADPLPRIQKLAALAALAEPTWAVVGGGDELLAPPRSALQAGATVLVLDNLEKIARYRNLLAIKNPNPANPLQDKIQFTLLRQNAAGQWEEARGEGGGLPAYRAGERFAFRIRHVYPGTLYIHILDFGLAYGVSLAYPAPGSNEKHEPFQTVEYGVQDNRKIRLKVLAEFQGQQGVETLKLIAATSEVDFSWMKQGGVRALDRGKPTLLEELLRRAGSQTRGETPKVPAAEEWTTVERSFLLQRS